MTFSDSCILPLQHYYNYFVLFMFTPITSWNGIKSIPVLGSILPSKSQHVLLSGCELDRSSMSYLLPPLD